jgi:hypothetical protein
VWLIVPEPDVAPGLGELPHVRDVVRCDGGQLVDARAGPGVNEVEPVALAE